MKNDWHPTKLGRVLRKSEDWIDLDPETEYMEVTVRLWGKGAVLRGICKGAEIAADRRLAVKQGQLILSRIDARNGALGLVPASLDGAVVSNDFPAFYVDRALVLPEFLGWFIKTGQFVELCNRASEGTTNRVRLKEERFLEMEVSLPPPEEQHRIVSRIEELSAKIGEARSLRQQAVEESEVIVAATARKVLAAVKAPVTKLNSWLNHERDGIQTGPFGAQLSSMDFIDSGIPVLTIGNVQYGGLRVDNLKFVSEEKARQLSRYRIKGGDLLFARMGTVGRCCIAPNEVEEWVINYHIIRVALDKARVEPRYIHWTIRASGDVEGYLDEKIRGATRQGVNSAIVGGLPCRVPSIEEQRRTVAYLDGLQEKVDAIECQQEETTEELNALMPSILSKAFSGNL